MNSFNNVMNLILSFILVRLLFPMRYLGKLFHDLFLSSIFSAVKNIIRFISILNSLNFLLTSITGIISKIYFFSGLYYAVRQSIEHSHQDIRCPLTSICDNCKFEPDPLIPEKKPVCHVKTGILLIFILFVIRLVRGGRKSVFLINLAYGLISVILFKISLDKIKFSKDASSVQVTSAELPMIFSFTAAGEIQSDFQSTGELLTQSGLIYYIWKLRK